MNHLTDEEFTEWLAGEANPEAQTHLDVCPQCRAEALQLRDGISRYSVAIRQQTTRAQHAHMAGTIAPRKVLALHRLRWAGAGVLAILLAVQTAWILKPHTDPAVSHRIAGAPTNPPAAPAMSDDDLLEAVNSDLNREVPLALSPVSAITVARNKIAASTVAANDSGK